MWRREDDMQEQLEFNPSFSMLTISLDPGEAIKAEPGAMVAHPVMNIMTMTLF